MPTRKQPSQPSLKLKWPGLTPRNTLIISVDKHDFAIRSEPIVHANRVFMPKPEAHITIFGSELGSGLLATFNTIPKIEKLVIEAFERTNWSYLKTNELRHLVRTRSAARQDCAEESIIMLLEMAGMPDFYERLKAFDLIPDDTPVPPPHVTMYVRNCARGIGVHSQEELAELSVGSLQTLP